MKFDLGLIEFKKHPNKKIQKLITDFEFGFIDLEKFKKNLHKQIKNDDIKKDLIYIIEYNIKITSTVEKKYKMFNLDNIKNTKNKNIEILDILNNMEAKKINRKFRFF